MSRSLAPALLGLAMAAGVAEAQFPCPLCTKVPTPVPGPSRTPTPWPTLAPPPPTPRPTVQTTDCPLKPFPPAVVGNAFNLHYKTRTCYDLVDPDIVGLRGEASIAMSVAGGPWQHLSYVGNGCWVGPSGQAPDVSATTTGGPVVVVFSAVNRAGVEARVGTLHLPPAPVANTELWTLPRRTYETASRSIRPNPTPKPVSILAGK